ncbi:hypothetical protein J7E99_06200 [Streptomyces sp. ISL-44]|uniref:hypothetical protein n=1 Tax=unclassified Streptomyces TaxID=2593676 RepID=UPI001BEA22AE|nr:MULTISPECIES: hypothetical protein [unclassified Streptomyces]MBT2540302.1 hypothetical protein [Streptomyces sp. ISL-44]MCX5014341.1 hypothetical protein [Streptomyces sp. NBC_00555]UUU42358.1 hypothetical protein JIW86_28210 [Streptomyces sp. NBC_00162]
MGHWWYRNIVEPGKLPLLLALLSFVTSFLVTRTITRMIRAGRGPFKNITPGGMHIHHVVPGVILVIIGGFGAVGSGRYGLGAMISAVLFGLGAGLVLDEFALILHLDDVYWSEQGRKSVEIVVLTAALVALVLGGFLPFGVNELTQEERQSRGLVAMNTATNFFLALIALWKGKARTALFGVVVPFVALIGAIRLARPGSPYAKRFYAKRPRARAKSGLRAFHHDRRWALPRRKFENFIGGTPDPERAAVEKPPTH